MIWACKSIKALLFLLDDKTLAASYDHAELVRCEDRWGDPWQEWAKACVDNKAWLEDYVESLAIDMNKRGLRPTERPFPVWEVPDGNGDRTDFPKHPDYPGTLTDNETIASYMVALRVRWDKTLARGHKLLWFGQPSFPWGVVPAKPIDKMYLRSQAEGMLNVQAAKRGRSAASRPGQEPGAVAPGESVPGAREGLRRQDYVTGSIGDADPGEVPPPSGTRVRGLPRPIGVDDGQVPAQPVWPADRELTDRVVSSRAVPRRPSRWIDESWGSSHELLERTLTESVSWVGVGSNDQVHTGR